MSNRPKRKPSRSVSVSARPSDTTGSLRTVLVVLAVVVALVIAGVVWLVARSGSSEPVLDAQAAKGKQVAIDKGCVSCHSPDGGVSEGPTWKGLYGHPVTLANGSTVTADDAYLTRAIREPNADIVNTYRPLMPAKPISDDEMAALLAYLHALG